MARRFPLKTRLLAPGAALASALTFAAAASPAGAKPPPPPPPPPPGVVLIDYSTVSAADFASGLSQSTPFDGVVVRGSDDQDPFNCAPLGTQVDDQAALASGEPKEGRYIHNLLHLWSFNTSQNWSWTNQSCVSDMVNAFQSLAQTAAAGGFSGLALDTEAYGQQDPMLQSSTSTVRAGARVGALLAADHLQLFMTQADSEGEAGMTQFVKGLSQGGTVPIDGNEFASYDYTSPSQYQGAENTLLRNKEYVAQATYLDPHTPAQIQADVAASLQYSNVNGGHEAWVYTDGKYGNWWNGTMDASVAAAVVAGKAAG
jgi:hypothetical protein